MSFAAFTRDDLIKALIMLVTFTLLVFFGFCDLTPPEALPAEPTPTSYEVVIEAATPTAILASEVVPSRTPLPPLVISIATSTPKPSPSPTMIPTVVPTATVPPESTPTQARPLELPRAGGARP